MDCIVNKILIMIKKQHISFLTLSSNPSFGTLVPHLRSLVIHRGCSPFFIHVFAITLALLVHNLDASSIHSVNFASIFGKSMNICLLVFVLGVALHILHLGFWSSTALINFPHLSHWSPLASSKPQPGSGQVPSTYLEWATYWQSFV